jgi:hypothetical protein
MPDVEGRARLSLSPTARIHFSSSSLSRTMELVVAPLLEKHLATPHDWPLHDRVFGLVGTSLSVSGGRTFTKAEGSGLTAFTASTCCCSWTRSSSIGLPGAWIFYLPRNSPA